ncbi:hypothetical protein [Dendronalium sp. ChiSLP03b]|uniref:hypothetical protein n=1 Tax=Dendronalium sp. ChiSLP03b TaxID=3075381 RepID=UPI00391CD7B0
MHSADGASQSKKNWTQQQSVTFGDNYYSPVKPFGRRLTVAGEGITDKERDQELAKLQNIGNAWQVVGKRFEVQKQMHNAHQKQFEAMGAGVLSATALTNASTTWNKYQVAVADNRVSRAEKNTAIKGVSIEVERLNVELEKKRAGLEKAKMDLEQALTGNAQQRLSIEADRELAMITGTSVTVTLPSFMQGLSGLLQPVEDIKFDD